MYYTCMDPETGCFTPAAHVRAGQGVMYSQPASHYNPNGQQYKNNCQNDVNTYQTSVTNS